MKNSTVGVLSLVGIAACAVGEWFLLSCARSIDFMILRILIFAAMAIVAWGIMFLIGLSSAGFQGAKEERKEKKSLTA